MCVSFLVCFHYSSHSSYVDHAISVYKINMIPVFVGQNCRTQFSHLCYYRILSRVPCAMQKVLAGNLLIFLSIAVCTC